MVVRYAMIALGVVFVVFPLPAPQKAPVETAKKTVAPASAIDMFQEEMEILEEGETFA